jgi:cellulose synthase/poly-beta-1,6-N-acetylglucosamine synthase-like glycosyltransferase
VASQALPPEFSLEEVLVVASGCTDGTEQIVEERARIDPKIMLIREAVRGGKASAISTILKRYRGDVLVLVNADARLMPRALQELLQGFDGSGQDELVCGLPIPESSDSRVLSLIEDVWWRLHNDTLQTLAQLRRGNHCCDELMAMKRGFASSIPADIINDGAYFGVLGATRGVAVQVRPNARVAIETPRSLFGLLRQRRRILRGHRQVAQLLGQAPYTLEGMMRRRPALVARILATELSGRPGPTLAFLFVALPLEGIAHILAFMDRVSRQAYRPAWPMVE